MELREFKDLVFEEAKKSGFSEYEIFYMKNSDFSLASYQKEIDKYKVTSSMGVSFRGLFNGKMGYAFTEILDSDSAKMVVDRAKENAELIDKEDKEFIYNGKDAKYVDLNLKAVTEDVDSKTKIDFLLDMEDIALGLSEKVEKLAMANYGEAVSEIGIINSHGLDLSHKESEVYAYTSAVVGANDRKYDGFGVMVKERFSQLSKEEIAKQAVEKALSKVGAKSIPSNKYKIVLDKDVSTSLLNAFINNFNAEMAQRGMSLLKDKEGQAIAASIVNIIDNPHLEGGFATRAFDAEGVPTKVKYLVKGGVMETLMHNLKTANKAGTESTGNASKMGYASPIGISPSNCYIEKGEKSLEQLFEVVKDGVYITGVDGIHAGANQVTGDFSLAARGFVIKDGKKGHAVEQITVAGNFFELLKNIEDVGNDLEFLMTSIASPSLIITELSIAGE